MSTVLTAITSCWQLLQAVNSFDSYYIFKREGIISSYFSWIHALFDVLCAGPNNALVSQNWQLRGMLWTTLSNPKKKALLEWKFQTTASNSISFKRGHEYTWLPFTAALQGPEGFCAFSAFSYHEGQFISLSETTWVLLRAVCFLEEIQMCGMCIWGNFARHGIRVGSGVDEVNMR